MDTLFKDKEVFQKERPTNITESQKQEFIKNIAQEIIDNGYSDSDFDEVLEDIEDLYPFYDTGFELAKQLDGYGSSGEYHIDSDFIAFLEDLTWKKAILINGNVKKWVQAHDIKPKFPLFTSLTLKSNISKDYNAGDTIFINTIKNDDGLYGISKTINDTRNRLIEFEKLEGNVEY